MDSIETFAAPALWCDPAQGVIARIAQELRVREVHAARTVVLVPYAQLMGVAREMWGRCGAPGFVPRFESTRNWARSAGGFVGGEDDIALDMGRNLLTAQSLLARAGFAAARVALAPRLVEIAMQLAPVVAAITPQERAQWAQKAQAAVSAGDGSQWFGTEAALNAIAVAWAANSSYETDVLHEGAALRQADLLVVLDGFQPDALAAGLARGLGERAVHIALAPLQMALEAETQSHVAMHAALDPEDEADRAAACVLQHLAQGHAPVALVATDRALTRRIGAQLAAHGVVPQDETGWKLSTTRAAATLMSALRACAHDASCDQVLDWLKSAPAFRDATVTLLESRLRSIGVRDWSGWRAIAKGLPTASEAPKPADVALAEFTAAIEDQRAALSSAKALPQWLDATRAMLQAGGQWGALANDAAGSKIISSLYLDATSEPMQSSRWTLNEFTGWVRDVLEAESAVLAPALAEGAAAQVVVLPLQHLLGRSFGAVVIPGCDDQRLPASPEPAGEWTTAQRIELGLPLREQLEAAQRSAWAIARQAAHCDLLWRQFDTNGEPVRPSALVQLLQLDGIGVPATDPRVPSQVAARPATRPQPHAEMLKVDMLSASAYDDLRRCPYRFFALRQLRLRDSDELDSEVDKRDFGNWLHTVLGHFHEALQAAPTRDATQRLSLIDAAAARATLELALPASEFLPFAASWPAVRDGYLEWLTKHEADGAQFVQSEADRKLPLGDVTLNGRLDRIDRMPDGQAFVIDYKTESQATTGKRIAEPFEDTQLAFYAALLDDDTLRAAYVNVGEKSSGTKTYEQRDVVDVRDALVQGVIEDMRRIAEGAPMPALGEGAVCEYCDARGLCRKDFWS